MIEIEAYRASLESKNLPMTCFFSRNRLYYIQDTYCGIIVAMASTSYLYLLLVMAERLKF